MIAVRKKPKTIRAATYTRKSISEGLDQEFSSLDAQREACEGYILSRRDQGWIVLPERYDDGGYTGANIERPAFQRLLKDIDAGKVDAVVVYRSDRLSRSLFDLMTLRQNFNRLGIELASVTERFDATTPDGRMMLNFLACYAEHEREVIAIRVRDKIHASRRRGMWTGGRPVLGYDVVEKKLVVNKAEAARVRQVFALYGDLRSLLAVAHELNARGWTTKDWVNKHGSRVPGRAFTKESVHVMLTNVLYCGQIRCGEETVKGQHEAIVEQTTWDDTQELLTNRATTPRGWRPPTRNGAMLRGILRCACGASMTYHYAQRNGRRYGFYVCARALKQGAKTCPGSRASAGALEKFVVDRVRAVGRDPRVLDATLAADREQRGARRPELDAELRRLTSERKRLEAERRNVVKAIGRGTEGLDDRLAEIDAGLAQGVEAVKAARRDLRALDSGAIDSEELRRALADFEPVWTELTTAERSRVLGLLLERITFLAESGVVEIEFRSGGHHALAAVKEPR